MFRIPPFLAFSIAFFGTLALPEQGQAQEYGLTPAACLPASDGYLALKDGSFIWGKNNFTRDGDKVALPDGWFEATYGIKMGDAFEYPMQLKMKISPEQVSVQEVGKEEIYTYARCPSERERNQADLLLAEIKLDADGDSCNSDAAFILEKGQLTLRSDLPDLMGNDGPLPVTAIRQDKRLPARITWVEALHPSAGLVHYAVIDGESVASFRAAHEITAPEEYHAAGVGNVMQKLQPCT